MRHQYNTPQHPNAGLRVPGGSVHLQQRRNGVCVCVYSDQAIASLNSGDIMCVCISVTLWR